MPNKATSFVVFLLAACAHHTGSFSPAGVRLLFPNDGLIPVQRPLYMPAESQFFLLKNAAGRLKIRSTPFTSEDGARAEIAHRLALLRQYAERQADPYAGPGEQISECSIEEKLSGNAQPIARVRLVVSSAYAINCYGKSSGQSWEERQFYYCPNNGMLFELSVFTPYEGTKPPTAPLAACP